MSDINKCDYCHKQTDEVNGTPYIADIPANMCRQCWDITPIEIRFDSIFKEPKFTNK